MQKMGLPEAAIRLKMGQEGISEGDIDSFFRGGGGGAPSSMERPAPPAGGGGMAALLGDIQGGAKLKKTKTNDRSAPKTSGGGVIK